MKKSLIVLVLAAAGIAAQAQAAPARQQPSASGGAATEQKKVIEDPAEYNAYMAAVSATDPAQKAQMMESYLQTYPNSVVKEDGLDFLLKTYEQLNNVAQMKATAQRLLQVDPKNLTALVVLTYLDHSAALSNAPDAATALKEAGEFGTRCLQSLDAAPMPEGNTAAQWESTKNSFRGICASAVGHAALQAGDYATAQQNLKSAVAAQPTEVSTVYQLALAYLTPKPPVVDGLFWIARAQALSPNPQLLAYAKNQYERYHGGADGFDELLATAKASPTIPAGFTVAPAPSPADQAADMLKKNTPDKLSFAEWQFILTSGNKDASDQVWSVIKGKPVQLEATVIDATRTSLKLAASLDDIDAKKADMTLALKEPLPINRVPKAGAKLVVEGAPSEYTAVGDAFNLSFTDGRVLQGLPEPPRKPSAAHKP